jgi:hypothetical protein
VLGDAALRDARLLLALFSVAEDDVLTEAEEISAVLRSAVHERHRA